MAGCRGRPLPASSTRRGRNARTPRGSGRSRSSDRSPRRPPRRRSLEYQSWADLYRGDESRASRRSHSMNSTRGDSMLDASKAYSGFAVTDTDQAKQFYGDTLGLDVRDLDVGAPV